MNSSLHSTPVLSLAAMEYAAEDFDRRHPSPTGAPTATVLLGPRAAHKERLARLIHATGERRTRPFVSLDCSTLAATDLSNRVLRRWLSTAGRGAIFLNHLTAKHDSLAATLLTTIVHRSSVAETGRLPSALDVQTLAAADVFWCDARQDEIAIFSVSVASLMAFLAEFGLGTPFAPDPHEFRLPEIMGGEP